MHDWNVRLNTENTLQPSCTMGTTRLLGLGIDWSTRVGFKPACLDMYVCGGSITKTMTFFWIYITRCTQFLNSSFLGFLFWHRHHYTNLTLRNWLHTRSVRKQQWQQPRTPLRTHFTPRSMQSFLNPLSALLFIFFNNFPDDKLAPGSCIFTHVLKSISFRVCLKTTNGTGNRKCVSWVFFFFLN